MARWTPSSRAQRRRRRRPRAGAPNAPRRWRALTPGSARRWAATSASASTPTRSTVRCRLRRRAALSQWRPGLDLVVLGDCNPDLVLADPELEPTFGQAERLIDDAQLTIGGSGAIMACAAARLGLRTALVAVVGEDLFGRFMVQALGERGVDTSAIVVDRSLRTGLTVILAGTDDRAILTYPGAIAALTAGQVGSASGPHAPRPRRLILSSGCARARARRRARHRAARRGDARRSIRTGTRQGDGTAG